MANCNLNGTCVNAKRIARGVDIGPRIVTMYRTRTGFGFILTGQVTEGGFLKCVNGELYAPLPFIKAVTEGGAADIAGLKKGDVVLEVNGINVEGKQHKNVVDLMKSCHEKITLTVISPQQSQRPNDYSERSSFPISVSNHNWHVRNGETFVVYDIRMAGKYLCSKRYRDIYAIHMKLKNEFPDFTFPWLPGKWPITLQGRQLNARRSGLDQYLKNVCAVRVIAESEIMQAFLNDHGEENSVDSAVVALKVLLPNRTTVHVNCHKNSSTRDVYEAIMKTTRMSKNGSEYFRLFEIVGSGFERKLQPNELPHDVCIRNCGIVTCLSIRKWVFCLNKELEASKDNVADNFFFWQAIDDISKGLIKPGSKINEVRALQEHSSKCEYLELVRSLDGYGEISFPHCHCDAKKEGHVVATVGFKAFKLQSCRDDGTMEIRVIEFPWDEIVDWNVDSEGVSFNFKYSRPNKSPRWVKVFTPYYVFMYDCFQQINKEHNWSNRSDSEQVFDVIG